MKRGNLLQNLTGVFGSDFAIISELDAERVLAGCERLRRDELLLRLDTEEVVDVV